MPFGIQPIHLVIIVVVALIIFGPQKLPEIGRGLGKSLNEFRKGAKEMTEGFSEEVRQPDKPAAPVQSQPMPQQPFATTAATAAPVMVACPNCNAANPSGAAFCNQCGTKLAY
jgi:TatA/E family protein of Tat protein translocase